MKKRTSTRRRTLDAIASDNNKLVELLDQGVCPKAVAGELNVGVQAVYHQARALGYRMLMVRQSMLNNLILKS